MLSSALALTAPHKTQQPGTAVVLSTTAGGATYALRRTVPTYPVKKTSHIPVRLPPVHKPVQTSAEQMPLAVRQHAGFNHSSHHCCFVPGVCTSSYTVGVLDANWCTPLGVQPLWAHQAGDRSHRRKVKVTPENDVLSSVSAAEKGKHISRLVPGGPEESAL